MKKIILTLLAMLVCCSSMAQDIDIRQFKSAIRQKIIKEQQITLAYDAVKKEYKTSNSVYQAKIKKNLNDSFPIGFEYDGKRLGFEFTEAKWIYKTGVKVLEPVASLYTRPTDFSKLTSIDSLSVDTVDMSKKLVEFPTLGRFKLSADMSAIKFKKVVNIDCSDLEIPSTAEYLELVFKLDTDMDLPPDGVISKRWELAEDCWLEPAKAGIVGATEYITIEHSIQRVGLDVFYIKRVPVSYLVGQVYTDADITFGSSVVFSSSPTLYNSCAALSSTSFVVSYHDDGNSDYGTSRIGTVSGTTITFGNAYVFNSGSTSYNSCAALSSTSFVVSYQDSGNSSYGTSCVGTVLGTVITFGNEYVFNSGYTSHNSCDALSSTSFVVSYQDGGNSSYGTSCVGTVSGTVITFGSEYVFNSSYTNYISCTALSSTSFVSCYRDNGNSDYGTSRIGTVSGTTITFGNEYVFNSGSTSYISCDALSSTSFVVSYQDIGNSGYGTSRIGTVSSTTITFGSEYVFRSDSLTYISCAALSSTSFVVSYRDNSYGTSCVGTVSGTVITFGSEYVFNSGTANYISCTALSSTSFVLSYRDNSNSYYGTSIVGILPAILIDSTYRRRSIYNQLLNRNN